MSLVDTEALRVKLSDEAYFVRTDVTGASNAITSSGDAQFRLTGTNSTMYPMAPDGDVLWFGSITGTNPALFADLDDFIDRDEDFSPGDQGTIAPWMRVTAALPANAEVGVDYIYYQTSEYEEIVGGYKKSNYLGYEDPNPDKTPDNDKSVTADPDVEGVEPVFEEEDEDLSTPGAQDALILRVSSDGNTPTQNLWVKEADRFSGIYEGYIRLTDADGNGSAVTDGEQDENAEENWGLGHAPRNWRNQRRIRRNRC